MNYLQAHYCAAFAHSVPAYITYCYGIALTNRYYIVDSHCFLLFFAISSKLLKKLCQFCVAGAKSSAF